MAGIASNMATIIARKYFFIFVWFLGYFVRSMFAVAFPPALWKTSTSCSMEA